MHLHLVLVLYLPSSYTTSLCPCLEYLFDRDHLVCMVSDCNGYNISWSHLQAFKNNANTLLDIIHNCGLGQ